MFNSIVSSVERKTEKSNKKAKYLPFACIVRSCPQKSFPSLSVLFVDVFCLTFYLLFLCVENGLCFQNGFNHSDHVW